MPQKSVIDGVTAVNARKIYDDGAWQMSMDDVQCLLRLLHHHCFSSATYDTAVASTVPLYAIAECPGARLCWPCLMQLSHIIHTR